METRLTAIPCCSEFSSVFFYFFAKTGEFCPESAFCRFLQGMVQRIAGKAILSQTIAGTYGEYFGQTTLPSREFAGKTVSQIGTGAARRNQYSDKTIPCLTANFPAAGLADSLFLTRYSFAAISLRRFSASVNIELLGIYSQNDPPFAKLEVVDSAADPSRCRTTDRFDITKTVFVTS